MSFRRRHFNTEYWVPAKLTKNQLETYCKILTDESNILCTQSKDSSFREGLRNILTSTQKCSIHLQAVERSPESSSTEAKRQNVEIASGKLNLLGTMLEEINKQSLKALILYEEIGCSGSCIGGILDEFLHQKFGSDSYEHVGSDAIPAARRTAEFNAKHKQFVFLLEKHACLSVMSLSSVSTVLIFNNDWTPMRSLKALERIKFDSQPKIFRLYSPFTVEENILFFAREKKRIDSLQRMSWVTCHNLLMRGADNLFLTLSELNCDKTPVSSSTMSEQSLMSDIEQLLQNSEGTGTINLSVILKVQVEGSYYMSSQMPIELPEISQEDFVEPSNYWNKLLKGKHTPEVVSEKVIKKRKVDKGSSVPFEQVFQDECTPISTAAQLQVSSAGGIEHQLSSGGHTSNQLAQTPTRKTMSSHPDPFNNELQIIRQKIEEELKNHKEALLFQFEKEIEKVQTQYVNKAQELHSENDATTTPQSPPAEPLLQALRAFHDGMCQDMDRRIRAFQDEIKRCMHAFHDERRQDMDRRMRASQDELRQQTGSMESRMAQQSDKCTRSTEKEFGAEDDEEGADPTAADDTLTAFPDEMRKQISSIETRMAQQSDACTRSAEGAEDDEEGADPTAAGDTLTAFPDHMHKQISSMETKMAQQSDACTCSAEEGAEDDEEGADPTAAGDTLTAFPDDMHKQISSMEPRMAQQSDACTCSAEEGADRTAADDTLSASRQNLLDNMGHSPCPCSYGKKLLILDVNGLLLAFHPNDKKKDFYTAFWRPYLEKFLLFCFEKFDVALWSSRTQKNLDRLIKPLKLTDKKLIFYWDQSHCINTMRDTLDCPPKPFFLKDLRKVWEIYKAYNAANTLLLDDSPCKALLNPPNTAVFPETFQHGDDKDTSLGPEGDLYMYLEKLAMAENVQNYVEQNPFGQRAITESDPSWEYYSSIIENWR